MVNGVVAVVLNISILSFVVPSTSADPLADVNGCGLNKWSAPHVSEGAGGIIAKAYWKCTNVPSTIHMTISPRGLFLFVCPSQPPNDETWIALNCTAKGGTHNNVSATDPTALYVRYVPPTDRPGASGSGWWIACATWYSTGPNGTGSTRTNFSGARQLTYP